MSRLYHITINHYFRKDDAEVAILNEIKKCTQNVNTSLLEQNAYIRACAEKKNLNLDKFRAQLEEEMKSGDKDKETTGK